ncbi:MAG: endonuclease domain-containing protein [Novosphingobium sp.]
MTKKTLSVRPLDERTEAPAIEKRGRGWSISDKRLDAIHDQARRNRMEPTPAQKLLGDKLVEANLGKFKLTRQQVIGSAIVDFACNPLRIAVSIDEGGDPAVTARRDKSLEAVGVKLVRFTATRVLAEPDAVVAEIVATMKASYDERGRARKQHFQTRGAPPQRRGY